MLARIFIFYALITATLVVAVVARYFGRAVAVRVSGGLLLWFTYVGVLGYQGVIGNTAMRPPGVVFVLVPVVVLIGVTVGWLLTAGGARAALTVPIWILVGGQVFRVVVELFLHQLWEARVIPRMLTYSGANLDIYVGATAPIVALIATRGRGGKWVALVWSCLGLVILGNVVGRAILTTPGPLNFLHAEVPNRMFGTFPFMFIPGFFVPLAVVLHVFGIRQLWRHVSPRG